MGRRIGVSNQKHRPRRSKGIGGLRRSHRLGDSPLEARVDEWRANERFLTELAAERKRPTTILPDV